MVKTAYLRHGVIDSCNDLAMTSHFFDELTNGYARVHDLATEAEEWSSLPAWIEFAPNNLCNLRCIMCGQSEEWPLEVMPKEKAIEVLDQVLPKASLLTPSAISEPMLGNIDLMAEKCREHDVYMNFTTNATVLNGDRLRKIADRMHHLFISFDSHIPEVFEAIRERADFNQVVANIREILLVAGELGIPVDFVAVMTSDNVVHFDGLVDFLADLGAAEMACELRIQLVVGLPEHKQHLDPQNVMSAEAVCEHLDRATERATARQMRFRVEMDEPFRRDVQPRPSKFRLVMGHLVNSLNSHVRDKYPGFCSMASHHLKISPDGTVFPCCRAPKQLMMGNVNEESIEEIWNGENYRALRRQMFSGNYPEPCANCDVLVANPAFKNPCSNESESA